MNAMSEQPVDDKAHIRHHLDLTGAEWVRLEPEGETVPDAAERAFVKHTDGETYIAMRKSNDPAGVTLIFTMTEWDAFVLGVRDGELAPLEDDDPS